MKRKKKKKQLNLEPLIGATITLSIMFLIYASFWWSSYTGCPIYGRSIYRVIPLFLKRITRISWNH